MKLVFMKLSNFRVYKEEVLINFGNLTAFVGKNDIGKSSILEALDIFFNEGKGVCKLDKDDINKQGVLEENREICISVCFDELPENIIIDTNNFTTLQSEYLLNENNQLEIIKKYPNAGTAKVFIKANHPTNPNCGDLFLKKDVELRAILEQHAIECPDRVRKSIMRTAIWNHYEDNLQLADTELDVTKGDTKTIWDKLQNYLPSYTLFQSDRKNCDGDNEVQDPLKEAVKEILSNAELRQTLSAVAAEVERKLREVSDRTLDKLREINPDIANNLNPVIPLAESLKWADVFKNVSISGDENIPINKRGSGTKRLILLSFFRAEAERRSMELGGTGVIYAIEEPETSQHTENQKKLIHAFLTLAQLPNTQIIITTHSANIVKELDFTNLRLISVENDIKTISSVLQGQLPYPSLNEVNHLAFTEISEEYHNELYGFIEAEGQLETYKNGKATIPYIKIQRDGTQRTVNITLTEYIRHQIHHPENLQNMRFSSDQLRESIELMRDFIQNITV
ncbi:MAG TPA: ATP/GTP-binding protein [Clostridiales bacterium]|nr:MAG: ATP/GTP-binding protein [Clostridiales bacterium GWD2_32_19]HCC08035.1 ATP/GTP-binding protein [Clostridiales bacterium]